MDMQTVDVADTELIAEIPEPVLNLQSVLYSTEDSDLVDLPSGGHASVREMTGNDQRSFMNRTQQLNGTAVQQLLGNCVETINDQPLPTDPVQRTKFLLDLLSGDRATLVFQIRRHSLGSDFNFKAKCPNADCGKEEMWEVDLNKIEDFPITPYKNGDVRDIEYESKLRPGLKIRFTHLDGHAEMTVLRKRNQLTALTDLELRQPHAWDEKQKRWIPVQLNRLVDRLITEMRQEIKATEGHIRTVVDVVCNACNQEVSFDLLMQPDFMTPSATS